MYFSRLLFVLTVSQINDYILLCMQKKINTVINFNKLSDTNCFKGINCNNKT